jgi:hypothetical protein
MELRWTQPPMHAFLQQHDRRDFPIAAIQATRLCAKQNGDADNF